MVLYRDSREGPRAVTSASHVHILAPYIRRVYYEISVLSTQGEGKGWSRGKNRCPAAQLLDVPR